MTAFNLKSKLRLGAAFLKDRHGGAAIIMGLMTPIIIGGLAFGAEVSGWELAKRQTQNAADTAAFAAGTQVRSGASAATIESAAEAVAEASGFDGGADNVDIEYPPATAPLAADGSDPNGDNDYVYVTLTQTAERNFTKFFSSTDSVTFQSSALAHVESGRPACVLALHPSASSVKTGGSASVTLTGCDVASNSIASNAIDAGASITTNCASAVGGVTGNGLNLTECSEAIENAPVTADPYKDVAAPTTCTSSHTTNQFPTQGSGATRCYTAGNNISFSGNGTTTLASNVTYVFKNTGASAKSFTLNGGHTLAGTNVTLYFEGKWDIKTNGNSTLNISAPTTGAYKGLAIWGDRNNEVNIDVSGSNGAKVVGAIYSPNKLSDIKYTGSSVAYSAGQCTQVIGGTVEFWGNSDFSTDCSNSGTTAIMAGQTIKIVG